MTAIGVSQPQTPAEPSGRSPWDGPPTSITVDFANLPDEPSFPAAETAVLGAVMLSPTCAAKLLPMLREEHFTDQPHRDTLAAIRTLWQQQTPIDPVLVHDQLRKDGHLGWGEQRAALFLHDCVEATYSPGNGTSYATIVLEYAARRRTVQAGVRIAQAAARGVSDITALLEVTKTEMQQVEVAHDTCQRLAPARAPVPLSVAIHDVNGGLRDAMEARAFATPPPLSADDDLRIG